MEFPQRKHPRLKGFDYSDNGVYFLTLCSKGRVHAFSSIVGRGFPDAPQIFLTGYGKTIEASIIYLNGSAGSVSIDKYVIMPNHVHLLVAVEAAGCGASGKPRPTETIPTFVSSLKRYTNRECHADLWQSGYYDHIIRDERDYLARWKYIDDNPVKWPDDELYN